MPSNFLTMPPLASPNDVMDHNEHCNLVKAVEKPTLIDVVNGRGQGVHKHPGNEKYRKLVASNKGIYARCPKQDKAKVSKGIVAAIREYGGRFLELDEELGYYYDIGDKRAFAKTSQALREGQTQIRRHLFQNQCHSDHEVGMIGPTEKPALGYYGYSFQVLESLYEKESPISTTHSL